MMNVKIGAHNYTILERTKDEDGMLNDGSHGYTLENNNLIVISKTISHSKKQVVLLHELLHAIRFVNDGMPKPKNKDDFEEWEHYFISLYENNLLAVLKDNPQLTEWMLNEPTSK